MIIIGLDNSLGSSTCNTHRKTVDQYEIRMHFTHVDVCIIHVIVYVCLYIVLYIALLHMYLTCFPVTAGYHQLPVDLVGLNECCFLEIVNSLVSKLGIHVISS